MTLSEKRLQRQTDAELVEATRRAEEPASAAFGELVYRYQRMVYVLALSLVRKADADDVAQEAFLRAFRNLGLLADPAKFGVWLRRITFGVAIDHVRARVTGDGRFEVLAEEAAEPADPGPSPLDRLEQNEVASRVLAALDRLPARYRVPFTLYHIDGLTHAKVARALGVPEGTVRSLVARARQKLARLLVNAPEVRPMTNDASSIRQSADVFEDATDAPPRFLHVLNGDSVRMTLERSDVPGTFAVYAEILHEGPVPPDAGTDHWRDVRARYLSSRGYVPYADALRNLETWDERLERQADYDEVVLWFEHDLFDQLLLVRHLAWFAGRQLGRTKFGLICIGEFPGFEPFHGLGQLEADELTSLLGTRHSITAEELSLGSRAWRAFTSADPMDLEALVREPGEQALPFLRGALRRMIEEYPAVVTGLPRTEREILTLLAAAPASPGSLFVAMQRHEERVFMGDTTFWLRVRDLAGGDTPLVSVDIDADDDRVLPRGTVAITDAGRDVVAGRADWVHLNGFDRWIGGVHLTAPLGGDVAWRYDVGRTELVRTG